MSRMTTVAAPNFRYVFPGLDIGTSPHNLRFTKTTRRRPRNQGLPKVPSVNPSTFNSYREATEMPPHRLIVLRQCFQDYQLLEGNAVEWMRYAPRATRIPLSSMHCSATANTAARASKGRGRIESDYIPLKTKLSSLVSFAPIVMVWLAVPSFSCQALIV